MFCNVNKTRWFGDVMVHTGNTSKVNKFFDNVWSVPVVQTGKLPRGILSWFWLGQS